MDTRRPGAHADVLRAPLRAFLRQSRARLVIVSDGAGIILAAEGMTGGYDIERIAALAAGVRSSSRALADVSGAGGWTASYHAGARRRLLLAPLGTRGGELLAVIVLGPDSSLGLVQVFLRRLARDVAGLLPAAGERLPRPARDAGPEIEASFRRTFGGGWPGSG